MLREIVVAALLCCFRFIQACFHNNLHSGWTATCHFKLREKRVNPGYVDCDNMFSILKNDIIYNILLFYDFNFNNCVPPLKLYFNQ